ncbi:transport particle bet3 [Babesia ovis]|uniref:Transport particle bet3 n=1 Tax=Babesia ovis TaxID=5869 RepID=A0A9W5TCR4_BABOV|nr:transport particle bet3 [Babesia ovis]
MELAAKQLEVLMIHEIVKYYFSREMRMTHHTPDRPEESQSQQSEAHASVRSALDLHGYYLGAKIANRLTLLQGRMWDQNSCVIFVCKNVWTYLFGENAGRLQSNSQGTYIILCDHISWLGPLGMRPLTNSDNNILRGFEDNYKLFYLYLLSGIVRGTLASLGLAATVTPSIEEAYKFKISLKD